MPFILSKPWSVADFENQRPHLTNFIKEKILPVLDDNHKRIIVRAPVKSGKREMVEYIAMRDKTTDKGHRVHAFLSAWHRKADAEQRVELEKHNLSAFPINSESNVKKFKDWLKEQLKKNVEIVLHLDECDHGSGSKQILSKIWKDIRSNNRITNILYSATPEEVLFSGEVDDEYDDMVNEIMNEAAIIRYTPPPGYCGPREFLQAGLVIEAKPFFNKNATAYSLSKQGKEAISLFNQSYAKDRQRNIIVLRLPYVLGSSENTKKDNKAFYQFLKNIASFPELSEFIIMADKDDKFGNIAGIMRQNIQWSEKKYWDSLTKDKPILIVIDQTSSRSTEWKCHNRLFATHEYRNSLVYSVASQAQERVNHYSQNYDGEMQNILVYGSVKGFQLSAGIINYKQYLHNEWKKKKIDKRRTNTDLPIYEIINTVTGLQHPIHNQQMTENEADNILQELDCAVEYAVSSRVKGDLKNIAEAKSQFFPCDSMTFEAQKAKFEKILNKYPNIDLTWLERCHNPFLKSNAYMEKNNMEGKIPGIMRGEYMVYDYTKDIDPTPGAGLGPDTPRLTVCYKEGHLGVALRWQTGKYVEKNTMAAFNSMYGASMPSPVVLQL